MAKLALQAGLWYNRGMKMLCSRDEQTPLERVTNLSLRRRLVTMDIVSLNHPQYKSPYFPLSIWRKEIMTPKDPEKAALQRQRMSESAKRRAARPGEHELRSERTKAQMARPGMREQKSQAMLAYFAVPENRQYNIERKRASLGPEYSQHMSEAAKRRDARPGMRERKSEQQKEVQSRPGMRERLSEAALAQFADPEKHRFNTERKTEAMQRPEIRQKSRERMQNQRNDPEFMAKWAESLRNKDRTSIEVAIASLLDMLGVEYESQKRFGRYIVDFFIPSKNLVVECDGTYWHQKPEVVERDARKDVFLASKGYNVLRIPEQDIRKNNLVAFYEAIA